MYLDNKQYLLEELKILDILLYREVQKSRATRSKQDHQNNELLLGSVITDDEIDEILRGFTISKKHTEDADIDDGSPTVAIHDSDLFSSVEVDKKDLDTNRSQPFESQETDVSKKNDVIDASNNESGNVENHHIEEKSLFNVKAMSSAVKSAAILSIKNGIFLGLPILSRLFNLTYVDQLILLIWIQSTRSSMHICRMI
jgi:hypothetical protein